MPIEFFCSGCRKRLCVPEGTEGRLAQCPVCGVQTPIPGAALGGWGEGSSGQSPARDFPPERAASWEGAFSGTPSMEGFALDGEGASRNGLSATVAHPAWAEDWHRQGAYSRVCGPANWLVGMSAMAFGLGLVSLVLVVLGMAAEGRRAAQQGLEAIASERTSAFVVIGLGLLIDLLVLLGSMKMKQLENYPLAMTAALLAVVPCTSPCCVVSIPFGIWALVVLTDPTVKAAFK